MIIHVGWVPYHHGMARSQVEDGGDDLKMWKVAANMSNKASQTADRRWSSRFVVGRGADNSWGSCESGNESSGP